MMSPSNWDVKVECLQDPVPYGPRPTNESEKHPISLCRDSCIVNETCAVEPWRV